MLHGNTTTSEERGTLSTTTWLDDENTCSALRLSYETATLLKHHAWPQESHLNNQRIHCQGKGKKNYKKGRKEDLQPIPAPQAEEGDKCRALNPCQCVIGPLCFHNPLEDGTPQAQGAHRGHPTTCRCHVNRIHLGSYPKQLRQIGQERATPRHVDDGVITTQIA